MYECMFACFLLVSLFFVCYVLVAFNPHYFHEGDMSSPCTSTSSTRTTTPFASWEFPWRCLRRCPCSRRRPTSRPRICAKPSRAESSGRSGCSRRVPMLPGARTGHAKRIMGKRFLVVLCFDMSLVVLLPPYPIDGLFSCFCLDLLVAIFAGTTCRFVRTPMVHTFAKLFNDNQLHLATPQDLHFISGYAWDHMRLLMREAGMADSDYSQYDRRLKVVQARL